MVPCRSCKMFHDMMLNCKVAANQLRAGTLPEPWLSANRLKELQERKAAAASPSVAAADSPQGASAPASAPKKAVKGVGRPRVYADPEARRKEYIREYMRARRAKKP